MFQHLTLTQLNARVPVTAEVREILQRVKILTSEEHVLLEKLLRNEDTYAGEFIGI